MDAMRNRQADAPIVRIQDLWVGTPEQVAMIDPKTAAIKWVGIKTDLIATHDVEILSGSQEGFWVVSGPTDVLFQLNDGDRVKAHHP